MKSKIVKGLYKATGKAHMNVEALQARQLQLEQDLSDITDQLELAMVTYEEGVSLINEIMTIQLGGDE